MKHIRIILKTLLLSLLVDTVLAMITFDQQAAAEVETTLRHILDTYVEEELFSTKEDVLFKLAEHTQAISQDSNIGNPICDNVMKIKVEYLTPNGWRYWLNIEKEATLFIFPKRASAQKDTVKVINEAAESINYWRVKNVAKIAVVCLENKHTGAFRDAIAVLAESHTDIWGSRRLDDIRGDHNLHMLTVRKAIRLAITDNPSPTIDTEHRTTLTHGERRLNPEYIEKLRKLSEEIRKRTPENHDVFASASYISHLKWDETQFKIVSTDVLDCLVSWKYVPVN